MAASGDAGGEGGHKGAGASRRNDATPRLLKGAGLSSGARRRRVPEAPDFARIAGSRPGQTGASGLCGRGVRWTRAARGVRLGGVRSPTGGLRSGRRDGRGQRSVRPSARHAPTASAQLFPRGVPLLRRAPGPRRGGDTGTEEHPGGCQPVHQVKRGPGGAALPGGGARRACPRSPWSPPPSCRGPSGYRLARCPSRQTPRPGPTRCLPAGQLLWLRPGRARAPHRTPLPLELTPDLSPAALPPRVPTARRWPGPQNPGGPQTPSWAEPGPATASRAWAAPGKSCLLAPAQPADPW